MPIHHPTDAERFEAHGSAFESFVSAARGAAALCAWRLEVAPGAQGVAHRPSHEEVMLLLRGQVTVVIDSEPTAVESGDVIHVPAGSELTIHGGLEGASAWVTTTAGLTAQIGETTFAPPWAQ